MEVGSALVVALVPPSCALGIIGVEWRRNHPDAHPMDLIRADPFQTWLLAGCLLSLLMPAGWWLTIPTLMVACGLQALRRPDARALWRERWRIRTLTCLAVVCGILLTGFAGVGQPEGSSDWGTPLLTENPNAPAFPASTQHTWVDGATILVVNHVRIPGTYSPTGSAELALGLLETSGTDEARLKQAVEQIPNIGLQAEWFSLQTVATGQSHDYTEATLPYTKKHILLGEGHKGAEMITVAVGEWGGEVRLLTIIKPAVPGLDPPFYHDPYAAEQVDSWLASTS